MTASLVILIMVLAVVASTVTLIVRGISKGKAADEEVLRLKKGRKSDGPVIGLVVRPLTAGDRDQWGRAWASYCDFYQTEVSGPTTEMTWSRILDPESPVKGFGAFDPNGYLMGFAHVVLHPHTWSPKTLCYLEDLFVAPVFRGRDVGFSVISYLWKLAEEKQWGRVYWHTEATNAAARRLYDRFRPADGYVRYTLTL